MRPWAMLFAHRRPAPPLDCFVESVWACRGEPRPSGLERVLPVGAPQLVVNLTEDQTRTYTESAGRLVCATTSGSILTGITTRAQIIDTDEQAYVAGVAFRPGGSVAFSAMPACELTDVDAPLDAVWGPRAVVRLRERLMKASTLESMLDALEVALRETLRSGRRHPAVAFALDRFGAQESPARVSDVTDAIALSPKRFIDRFKAEVGLTPKRYCRLLRFRSAVARAHRMNGEAWVDLAAACGYFDQAHFIHDFREFSGMTPGAYEAGRTPFQNHVTFLQSESA
jgi:AraC-like DNA-binding protein